MIAWRKHGILGALALIGCAPRGPIEGSAAAVETARLLSPAEAPDLDPAPGVVRVQLRAAAATRLIHGVPTAAWAYNDQVPGPTLRARVGDTLIVELDNDLPDATTIHWHGLSVPYAMDGVSWQHAPVLPGESFVYTFTLSRAGTFWYHPHMDSAHQVDLGLYGALVVEDPTEPLADRELVIVLDAEGLEHRAPDAESMGEAGGAHPHGLDAFATDWLVNGVRAPVFDAQAGERVRVRLLNVSNRGYLELAWPGLRQIASDQGLLPAPRTPASLLLAPGDRAEVEWLIGESFAVVSERYSLYGGRAPGETLPLWSVAVGTPGPAPAPLALPFSAEAPSPDPGSSDLVYVFSGSDEQDTWMINGQTFPAVSIDTLPLGADAVIEVRNLSPTEHPFHVHGHRFEVLRTDDGAPDTRSWEDTINVRRRERVRLRLLADNPGEWMTHCHILPHAEGGMMTVLRVGP